MVANSLGWASFMFVSTNPRYQMVNAVEQVASPAPLDQRLTTSLWGFG